jgi:hypothetical protein
MEHHLHGCRQAVAASGHWQVRQHIFQHYAHIISILVTAANAAFQSTRTREPYHTSALTGEEWVLELICGHPQILRRDP